MATLVQELKRRYGVSKVYRWSGYADDSRERNVVSIVENAAKHNKLIPSYLYTIAIGEGFNLWLDDNYGPKNVYVERRINGFDYLGVDHFDSDFNRVKKFLPKDYNRGDEFTGHTATNEWHNSVQSAGFKNVTAGIQAVSATLAHRRERFEKDSKDLGYTKKFGSPNEDQLHYWLYVYYQGEGRARTYLQSNGGYLYTKTPPLNMNQVKQLALDRVAAWRYVQSKRLFTR